MRLLANIWFRAAATVSLLALLALTVATLLVLRGTSPPRRPPASADVQSLLVGAEEVEFPAVDGLLLRGWFLSGAEGRMPLILCHDVGESRSSLVSLAMLLQEHGFPLLLFDFRGHGASAGSRSTFGLKEKRDILGALDHLASLTGRPREPVGIYGAGMGAHAAVLAAADRPALRVLALDGLYPDAGYPLVRGFYSDWDLGVQRLGYLPQRLFTLMNRTSIEDQRAAEVVARLAGRDLLLLAPAGDSELAGEIQRMYETIPHRPDVEGNLILLPATQSEGLYGEDLERHHRRVAEFFLARQRR